LCSRSIGLRSIGRGSAASSCSTQVQTTRISIATASEDYLRSTTKRPQLQQEPVERYFRNSRIVTNPDGTTPINQLIIGRNLTGIDAFS
jgi:alkylation response protein AidB-like acyl-CoA dehydrogenase